jgi:hypothetical protein
MIIALVFALLLALSGMASAQADPANALRQKYAALQNVLAQNPFGRPLSLASSESGGNVRGDIYALVNYPFERVKQGLNQPAHWCEVMLLHINTKYCYAQIGADAVQLRIYQGKKTPQALAEATRLDFRYTVQSVQLDYLAIALNAPQGPLGTSDYRIVLEVVELPDQKTFLHLSYAWASNLAARLALRVYLNTAGNNKVGFSLDGSGYIGGIRGLAERNTMRYYLAIDSYLETATLPPASQLNARLQSWFTATERYPRQLHESAREDYISMKQAEYLRQQTLQ